MREIKIETYLKTRIEANGGQCIKFPPLYYAGFPDRIVLMPRGVLVFVETKATGRYSDGLQKKVHGRLRALGFRVEVIDSQELVDALIVSL